MRLGAVSLVPRKTVLRVKRIQLLHTMIPINFCEDARRADGIRERVPLDDVPLRQRDSDAEVPVDEHDVRFGRERLDGALHAQFGRLEDIDAVNGLVVLLADGIGKSEAKRS